MPNENTTDIFVSRDVWRFQTRYMVMPTRQSSKAMSNTQIICNRTNCLRVSLYCPDCEDFEILYCVRASCLDHDPRVCMIAL
jgi:hypothetical protein